MSESDKQVKTKTGAEALDEWLAKNREVSALIKKAAGAITAQEQQVTVTVKRMDGSSVTAPTQASWNEVAKAFQELVREVMATPFIADLEAHGFTRYDYAYWLTHTDQDLGEVAATAREEVKQYEHLPADEYIQKFIEIENSLNLDLCLEFLTKRREAEKKTSAGIDSQPNAFSLIGRPTTAKCVGVGFNDNRFQELCWYLTPQHGEQKIDIKPTARKDGTKLPGGKIYITNLSGDYELSKFDRLVLAALWTVSREPKNKASFLVGDPVPVATIPLVVLQLSGNKSAAYNPDHSIYKIVKESIERLHEKVWRIDLREIIRARGLHTRGDIGTIARPLAARTFEGEPVTIMTPQGDEHEAWTVRSCWIEEAQEKIFNNAFDFSYYREFFPKDVRNRRSLDLFVELLQKSTNRAAGIRTIYLRAVDAPRSDAYALFPALGWFDISELKSPSAAERMKDNRLRDLVETQLDDLVATGCFCCEKLRHPAIKEKAKGRLYGFRLKFLRGIEPIEQKNAARQLGGATNRAKRKAPSKRGCNKDGAE